MILCIFSYFGINPVISTLCVVHISMLQLRAARFREGCVLRIFRKKEFANIFLKKRIISRNYQCLQLVRVLATLHGCEKSSSLLHKKSFYEKVFQFQVSRVKKIKNSVVTLLRAKCMRFCMVSVFYNAA